MLRLIFIFLLFFSVLANSTTMNGFDLSGAAVPITEIQHGGPPRDGIPAINQPHYVSANEADFMRLDDRVLGLELKGQAYAYPLFIMNWHEIVNDQISGKAFVVSYCPLCGTGMAFESKVQGRRLVFGVSGLLYNSDVLFYDKATESLWSQIRRQAIVGPSKGLSLKQLPLQHTLWFKWQQQYPNTRVLTPNQGHKRNYRRDPYRGYETSRKLFFDVAHKISREYHPKEQVLGVLIDDRAKAYPFKELLKKDKKQFADTLAGRSFIVKWDKETNTASVEDMQGKLIVSTVAFWFAWYAFHPETEIFRYR